MSDMRALYQEVILEHNKKPRNFKILDPCTHQAHGYNPLCGDDYTVYIIVNGDTIEDIAFQGSGCAISKASASMMTSRLKGKSTDDAEKLIAAFREMMTGQDVEKDRIGHLKVFEGVSKLPSRIKCAVLPWHALHAALNGSQDTSTEGGKDEWDDQSESGQEKQ